MKVCRDDKTKSDQTLEVHNLCYYTLDSKHCICNLQLRRINILFLYTETKYEIGYFMRLLSMFSSDVMR